jgi:ATP-dependent exoDNAse (exonuclease V) beta subunit
VIPINSTTGLWSDMSFLYRRYDDSVHFKVFDFPSPNYDSVVKAEQSEVTRERVRLWYVALTRARDLLLLPRQTERIPSDWLSLVTLDVNGLPALDLAGLAASVAETGASVGNTQDLLTWEKEAATIAVSERKLVWHQTSRHEGPDARATTSEEVFVGVEAFADRVPVADHEVVIQGGSERGLVLHKLMEEVLTGETPDDIPALKARASTLIEQLGLTDQKDASKGLSGDELASAVQRTLQLPEVAELRQRLHSEVWVYAGTESGKTMSLTAGISDAVAVSDTGRVEVVVDWKSDIDPAPAQVELYRVQVRDYLAATGAPLGLIVFMTSGRIERVHLLVAE